MKPVARTLGTEVFAAEDDDRQRALLLSDLHVKADGGAVLGDLATVLELAREGAARTRLFLLGDLFDSYLGPPQLRVGVWREVAAMLRRTVDSGVSLTVLHGNRDFLMGSEFARATGARVVQGGVRCRLGDRTVLLLHGDELCVNDLPYQRAKKWLRNPVTRWLVRRLPLGMALRVAARARERSRRVIQSGDQTRFLPTREAVTEALRTTAADVLVFGHIHRLATGALEAGTYCVLPAFDQQAIVVRADAAGLGFAVLRDGALAGQVAAGGLWD